MRLTTVIVASVALFLVAAKSHGRQIRLEREIEGHHSVVFGATNHPWVDALWRRDRYRFWAMTPLFAVGLVGLLRLRGGSLALKGVAPQVVSATLWAPTLAFLVLGALSASRLQTALSDPTKAGAGLFVGPARDAWARDAVSGSVMWWGGALLLATGVGLLAAGLGPLARETSAL